MKSLMRYLSLSLAVAGAFFALPSWADAPKRYVTYIQSTGAQKVLLDYTPTASTRIEADVAIVDRTKTSTIYCSRNGATTDTFTMFYIMNKGLRCDYQANGSELTGKPADSNRHLIAFENGSAWIDGTSVLSGLVKSFTPGNKMSLFASYNNAKTEEPNPNTNWAYIKMYGFKAYEDGKLVLDLYPCETEEGKVGLWDDIHRQLYLSGSTTAFISSGEEAEGPRAVFKVSGEPEKIGTPDPNYGFVNDLVPGESYDFTCPAVWTNETSDAAATCVGWQLRAKDGSVLREGKETSLKLEYAESMCSNTLVWCWKRDYKVAVQTVGSGTTTGSGWYAEGATAKLSATPAGGYQFSSWTINGVTVLHNPCEMTVSANTAKPSAGFFNEADNTYTYIGMDKYGSAEGWKDGRMPTTWSAASTKVVVASGAGGSVAAKPTWGYVFEAPMNKNFQFWTSSDASVGAGGVTASNMTAYIYGFLNLKILATQRWLLDSEKDDQIGLQMNTAYGAPLLLASEATWTLCGRAKANLYGNSSSDVAGAIRSNMRLYFAGDRTWPKKGLYWTNKALDEGAVHTNASGLAEISFTLPLNISSDTTHFSPLTLDLTNPKAALWGSTVTLSDSTSVRGTKRYMSGWSGAFNDGVLKLNHTVSEYVYNPFDMPRLVLDTPGTLDTATHPRIRFYRGLLELADDQALGAKNDPTFLVGSCGETQGYAAGCVVGILAAPGITVGATVVCSNKAAYLTYARPIYLGTLEAGEPSVYTGDIQNDDTMIAANRLVYDQPASIRLVTGKGAEARFTGKFSGSKHTSPEVVGYGTVRLSGDNSGLLSGVSVRAGELKVGSDKSLGTFAVKLGGSVPAVCDVTCAVETNVASWTKSPLVIDGHTLQPGDRILDVGNRVFKEYTGTTATNYVPAGFNYGNNSYYGHRIRVTSGERFTDAAFEAIRGWEGGAAYTLEVAEPSVALLADAAMTIANDINVTDNQSTGTSTIGVSGPYDVTYAGTVTLNRGVTFSVAAGGKMTFTGTVADAAGQTNAVAVIGAGTVVLPTGFDWTDRTLDLRGLTEAGLDAGSANGVTLLRSEGLGSATVLKPASLGKWKLMVRRNSVRASKSGLLLLVR